MKLALMAWLIGMAGAPALATSIDWTDATTGLKLRWIGNLDHAQAEAQCHAQGIYWKLPSRNEVDLNLAHRISTAAPLTDALLANDQTTGEEVKAFWAEDYYGSRQHYIYMRSRTTPLELNARYSYKVFPTVCLYSPFESAQEE